jgi:mannose-6-phosphate isomerase
METLVGAVQHYAWGDHDFIPNLLGVEGDGRPWAELWLGTHPGGPTRLSDGRLLEEVTGRLPYLLKVLAAGQPLSLQTHPNSAQAVAGHRRGAYPDDQPKPELLCALTRFEALCGVRPVGATLELLDEVGAHELRHALAAEGPGAALTGLYRRRLDAAEVIAACATSERLEAQWVRRLDHIYPGDPSVAATLLLNLVVLEPGQALRLDPGNLHAYLSGAGIELMGASDNVVRGGLTVKPVDIDDLLDVLDATPLDEPVLPSGDRCDLPAAGVSLLRLDAGVRHLATGHELSIDMQGVARHCAPGETLQTTATTYVAIPYECASDHGL